MEYKGIEIKAGDIVETSDGRFLIVNTLRQEGGYGYKEDGLTAINLQYNTLVYGKFENLEDLMICLITGFDDDDNEVLLDFKIREEDYTIGKNNSN